MPLVCISQTSCITTRKEQGLARGEGGLWEEKGVEGKVGYILAAFLIRDGNRVGTRGDRDKAQGLRGCSE